MNRLLRTPAARGAAATALTGLVAAVTVAATPAAASADTTIKVKYPVHDPAVRQLRTGDFSAEPHHPRPRQHHYPDARPRKNGLNHGIHASPGPPPIGRSRGRSHASQADRAEPRTGPA